MGLLLNYRGVEYCDYTYPSCLLIVPFVYMLVGSANMQLVVCGMLFGGYLLNVADIGVVIYHGTSACWELV